MSEPPQTPPVLGIESVEWVASGRESLTVRVTGRWRRRRPAWSSQPVLVLEAVGRRLRFPAMPEPPSLSGAEPGTWRISFSIPVALAPELGGRGWLQFGAVLVPLPAAVTTLPGELEAPPATGDVPGAPQAPSTQDAPRAPPAEPVVRPPADAPELEDAPPNEVEAEPARTPTEPDAAAPERRIRELERELDAARTEAERLGERLAAGERMVEEAIRSRREAEQRAHAEQDLRHDLARRLQSSAREERRAREAAGQLASAEERIRELEAELDDARRRGDEAEQTAAASAAARERAELRLGEAEAALARSGPSGPRDERLRMEQAMIGRRWSEPRAFAPARRPAAAPVGRELEILRRELEARARAEASLRTRLVDAESRLAARRDVELRTAEVLDALRVELAELRAALEQERAARLRAERGEARLLLELDDQQRATALAVEAIGELRRALGVLREAAREHADPPPGDAAAATGEREPAAAAAEAGDVEPARPPAAADGDEQAPGAAAGDVGIEPERFTDALARLRRSVPAPEEEAAAPGKTPRPDASGRAWLEPLWVQLAREDPAAAGRLLIELLPAQAVAYPGHVSYDLVFEGHGCTQVTVSDRPTLIRYSDQARPESEVDFQVRGEPAAIARLLIAGPLRRRFGRGVARVRGGHGKLAPLRALLRVGLDLRGLHRVGVRLEPELALRLVALMVAPGWTARERFAIGFAPAGGSPAYEPTYLVVRPGRPVQVSRAAPGELPVTMLSGPAGLLPLALSGERLDAFAVTGDEWPLILVRTWIKLAQSG